MITLKRILQFLTIGLWIGIGILILVAGYKPHELFDFALCGFLGLGFLAVIETIERK